MRIVPTFLGWNENLPSENGHLYLLDVGYPRRSRDGAVWGGGGHALGGHFFPDCVLAGNVSCFPLHC